MKKQILLMALSLCVSGVFAQDANKVKSEGDEALKAKITLLRLLSTTST